MVNFTIAHEYGHIAHGHLKDYACENNIDVYTDDPHTIEIKAKGLLIHL